MLTLLMMGMTLPVKSVDKFQERFPVKTTIVSRSAPNAAEQCLLAKANLETVVIHNASETIVGYRTQGYVVASVTLTTTPTGSTAALRGAAAKIQSDQIAACIPTT